MESKKKSKKYCQQIFFTHKEHKKSPMCDLSINMVSPSRCESRLQVFVNGCVGCVYCLGHHFNTVCAVKKVGGVAKDGNWLAGDRMAADKRKRGLCQAFTKDGFCIEK